MPRKRVHAQGRSVEDMLPEVTRQMDGFLKDGLGTEGHDLLRVIVGTSRSGGCGSDPTRTSPARRGCTRSSSRNMLGGEGIGRATMLAAEALVASRGVRELGLNVFGHNERAIHLYRSLGYATTSMNMAKPLEGPTG